MCHLSLTSAPLGPRGRVATNLEWWARWTTRPVLRVRRRERLTSYGAGGFAQVEKEGFFPIIAGLLVVRC
jgi:hypothetical protein